MDNPNQGWIEVPAKTHAHCKSPGCFELATGYTHPNIGWCDKHGTEIIRRTIRAIIDGTHHDLS